MGIYEDLLASITVEKWAARYTAKAIGSRFRPVS
jgi:hypothetical protein